MPNETMPLVLITGSSGLIGTKLIERLSGAYRVVGLDVKPPATPQPEAAWLECDLTDDAAVAATMDRVLAEHGSRMASVVHLAAYYDFAGEPSPLYDELTVQGTRRLLESLQRFDSVEQFIFSSSLLVMEPTEPGELLTEDSPTQAEWDYPRSKLEAEAVVKKHREGIPALILRIAGVYDEDGHSIPIGQQIARIYENKLESHFFPGDADRGQAFVHLADLMDCVESAIGRRDRLPPYEILLIAEPDVMSYRELQDAIGQELYGETWRTLRVPKPAAKAGAWIQGKLGGEDGSFIKPWMIDLADQHYAVDIGRARERLGWEPRRRLRITLPEILARLKADPQGWYERNGLTWHGVGGPMPRNQVRRSA